METRLNLNAISIILVRSKFHENIGSIARAMKNMSLNRLVIVDGCSPLHRNAYKLASGAEELLDRAEECFTLKEAISEIGCVVGMTSRRRKDRCQLLSPRVLAEKLVPISFNNSIGLVFGPEREGLTNEELSLCHLLVKIPSSETFPSLNLAQAVMVICYELLQSSCEVQEQSCSLAPSEHLERLFDRMEDILLRVGFLDRDDPKRIMNVLRGIFARSLLDERELRILQGVWRQMEWYIENKVKD